MSNPLLSFNFHKATFIASGVASCAAVATAILGLPPWLMFIGWVAYFTKPGSATDALSSGVCTVLGFLTGLLAAKALSALMPVLGVWSFAAVVFPVAFWAVSMRAVPCVNNVAAWFLGLIAFFAAHPDASFMAMHIAMIIFGVSCGFITAKIQALLAQP